MSRQIIVIFALLISALACDDGSEAGEDASGGGGTGGGDAGAGGSGGGLPPSDPFDPAGVAERLAQVRCDHQAACQPILEAFLPQTPAECVTKTTATLRMEFEALVPLITARRVAFKQDAFDRCVAAHAAAAQACSLGVDPVLCAEMFAGGRRTGQGCSSDLECPGDGVCLGENTALCRICAARAHPGEDCSEVPCVVGSTCVPLGADLTCVRTTLPLGSPCFTPETGLCIGELQCVGEDALTCQQAAGLGEPCEVSGSRPDCNLQQGDVCGPGGTCVAVTIGALGSACGPATTTLCGSKFFCNFNSMQCEALPGEGALCPQGTCGDGLYCEATCQPKRPTGAACTHADQCAEACIDGLCGPLRYAPDCGP